MRYFALFLISILFLSGCSRKNQNEAKSEELSQELNKELLGTYIGHQSGFAVKDKNGNDMILRGNRVLVPASDYKFELGEKNKVTMYNINEEMLSPDVYKGSYNIVREDNNKVVVFCRVSFDKYTNPEYTIVIDKATKSAVINNPREPEIQLTKLK